MSEIPNYRETVQAANEIPKDFRKFVHDHPALHTILVMWQMGHYRSFEECLMAMVLVVGRSNQRIIENHSKLREMEPQTVYIKPKE